MEKVKLDTIKPWITERLNDLLGFEDDVVIEFVFNLLESNQVWPVLQYLKGKYSLWEKAFTTNPLAHCLFKKKYSNTTLVVLTSLTSSKTQLVNGVSYLKMDFTEYLKHQNNLNQLEQHCEITCKQHALNTKIPWWITQKICQLIATICNFYIIILYLLQLCKVNKEGGMNLILCILKTNQQHTPLYDFKENTTYCRLGNFHIKIILKKVSEINHMKNIFLWKTSWCATFKKSRHCAANGTRKSYVVIHEISHNSIITLLCVAKEVYLEQTALNHYYCTEVSFTDCL